ncbi:hypothetical protein GCM10025868_22850 [Angustibacter aerolatus]|uniref:Uncharacterized protein n=1 Tax=Angustibacter aerolatus TaxID=1162965 RepID=A0ABQ6JIH5_9ACTN|nr:hypothetical protein [Angustibacter aerolatus]GMA87035.1 hypothetical protein GCM10025868_22850 [Angustibacter aerolatus]
MVGRHDEVAGLDVAVDEAGGVGGVQRVGGLLQQRHGGRGRHRAVAGQQRRERLAGHELHDEVGGAVVLAVVVDLRDARVAERRRVPGLGAEPAEEPLVGGVLAAQQATATTRPSTSSSARQTSPMPPPAIGEVST